MNAAPDRSRLHDLLAPVAERAGLDLEDVQVTPAGRRRVVRVIVDADDGVGLDLVAEVSRSVSDVLDASDALGATPYVLEVSSPGVDRPLTAPRHWQRATGRLVRAVRADGSAVTGRVTTADTDAVTLDTEGGAQRLRYADLTRAAVEVEFNRPERSGASAPAEEV